MGRNQNLKNGASLFSEWAEIIKEEEFVKYLGAQIDSKGEQREKSAKKSNPEGRVGTEDFQSQRYLHNENPLALTYPTPPGLLFLTLVTSGAD